MNAKFIVSLMCIVSFSVEAAFFVEEPKTKQKTEVIDRNECSTYVDLEWVVDDLPSVVRAMKKNSNNSFSFSLDKGWEVFSALDSTGKKLYMGKVNSFHVVNMPSTSESTPVIVKLSNLKSQTKTFKFVAQGKCNNSQNQNKQVDNMKNDQLNHAEIRTDNRENFSNIVNSSLVPIEGRPSIDIPPFFELLTVHAGERISDVTKRIADHFGYQLYWNAKDMVFDINLQIPTENAKSIESFLTSVISPSGYKFMIHDDQINRVVVVRD